MPCSGLTFCHVFTGSKLGSCTQGQEVSALARGLEMGCVGVGVLWQLQGLEFCSLPPQEAEALPCHHAQSSPVGITSFPPRGLYEPSPNLVTAAGAGRALPAWAVSLKASSSLGQSLCGHRHCHLQLCHLPLASPAPSIACPGDTPILQADTKLP